MNFFLFGQLSDDFFAFLPHIFAKNRLFDSSAPHFSRARAYIIIIFKGSRRRCASPHRATLPTVGRRHQPRTGGRAEAEHVVFRYKYRMNIGANRLFLQILEIEYHG